MTATAARRQALGAYGESVAATYLVGTGMVLLDRNWRCDVGEIDLVLRDGDVLVVCEVKTRRDVQFGTPHEAVTETKVQRLRLLAERWVVEHGVRPGDVRIDLVAILRPLRGPSVLDHVLGVG